MQICSNLPNGVSVYHGPHSSHSADPPEEARGAIAHAISRDSSTTIRLAKFLIRRDGRPEAPRCPHHVVQVLEVDPYGNLVWVFRNRRHQRTVFPRLENGLFKKNKPRPLHSQLFSFGWEQACGKVTRIPVASRTRVGRREKRNPKSWRFCTKPPRLPGGPIIGPN